MKFSTQALWLITPELESALRHRGIADSDQLLAAARTSGGRAVLARATGLSPAEVLQAAVRADLARVRGVGSAYAELLEAAGVNRVQVLARCKAEVLRERLAAANAEHVLVGRIPSLRQVSEWIAEARRLPVMLE